MKLPAASACAAWTVIVRRLLLGLAWGSASALTALPGPALASDDEDLATTSGPLQYEDVLSAVYSTHPGLEKAGRGLEKAEGERFSAQGAWDPRLQVDAKWTPGGYYRHREVDAQVKQATPLYGTSLYAGYRLGRGDYPVYKGELATRSGGEVRAGVQVPLLRDGAIDKYRARIARANELLEASRCSVDKERLSLAQKSAQAYLKWVSSGLVLRIQRGLLNVAQERDARLRQQVALGSLARVVTLDNERLVLDRRAKLAAAERKFQHNLLALSLFLRDAAKRPIRVSDAQLPTEVPRLVSQAMGPEDADVEDALRVRPELCMLRRQRRAAEVDIDYAGNQVAPALHAKAFVSRDLGEGPAYLGPTEYGVGVHFEMPLLLREARGKRDSARAAAAAIEAELRAARDAIAVEVAKARVDVETAERQLLFARRQAELSRALAEAERERFAQGSSDLVVVNLRELAAADAERLEVEAHAAHEQAMVDYLAARGQTP